MRRSGGSYDYIITGMGCAGLSLAVQLHRSGMLRGKRVLLIDKERKEKNDRTWCFWETEPGPFEDIVYRKWDKAWFHAEGFSSLLDLSPYQYKMIRGEDYYQHCMQILSEAGLEFKYATVDAIEAYEGRARVIADEAIYDGAYLFNSILFNDPIRDTGRYYLLQHFKGWIIETPDQRFNTEEATLMDFRPSQENGTTFIYVMPLAPNRALVEYTLFSPELLKSADYDKGLRDYIEGQLNIKQYRVAEEEFGVIPMTNHRFPRTEGPIMHMGTAGGQTKASSGYTFRFIQKHVGAIVDSLRRTGHPFDLRATARPRFFWYDSVLLNILHHRKLEGWYIFRQLFRKNKASTILRFLDNETSMSEEFRLLNTLPQWPFMKAGVQELLR